MRQLTSGELQSISGGIAPVVVKVVVKAAVAVAGVGKASCSAKVEKK